MKYIFVYLIKGYQKFIGPLLPPSCRFTPSCSGIKNGKAVKTGGIEWTIRDGIPFHAPTLAAEVRALVAAAKKK